MSITTTQIRKFLRGNNSLPATVINDNWKDPYSTLDDIMCKLVASGRVRLDASKKPQFVYLRRFDGARDSSDRDQPKELPIDWNKAAMTTFHGYAIIYTPQSF